LHNHPTTVHPDLIVGLNTGDDAGVLRMPDGRLMVQTVDYFTPVVDDPNDWGRIAAANALSDIYAMGATPSTALQLIGWPRDKLPFDLLGEVILGGIGKLEEAGCLLIGGHSIDAPEPTYGFAVTGFVAPDQLTSNGGARPGDRLVLTKPIGTGIISTAVKSGRADPAVIAEAIEVMAELNAAAARAMAAVGVHAATDVTGFGLLGHLGEMLAASGVAAVVEHGAVPLIDGVRELAEAGVVPGGTGRNLIAVERFTDFGGLDDADQLILADAQTSGGLLIAVAAPRTLELVEALTAEGTRAAAIVGAIVEDRPGTIDVR
jgi:selenide,water dikinase